MISDSLRPAETGRTRGSSIAGASVALRQFVQKPHSLSDLRSVSRIGVPNLHSTIMAAPENNRVIWTTTLATRSTL